VTSSLAGSGPPGQGSESCDFIYSILQSRGAEALAEGFLGGAFAGAAGLRGAALPAGRLLIDLIRRDVDLTMEFTGSVAPRPNDHGRRCRRKPGNLRAAKGFPVTG
jgi:hypothetical protein